MSSQHINPFISYYGQHAISPVRQNISNFEMHLLRRENLYRTLGLPVAFFSESHVLEVGPGGGYNTLALFSWGSTVDLVEPNPTACLELKDLFRKYDIKDNRWSLYEGVIEKFSPDKQFNIVLAEGFIPGLYERSAVVSKLKQLVKPGGVIVVTCVDVLSAFFENLRRLIAFRLVATIPDFKEKVRILSIAFESHLRSLRYASRLLEDWVKDALLNPGFYGKFFSISDCIDEFGAEFDFLGSSPAMITNYNWYKNVDFDLRAHVLEQFNRKRHNLLLWDIEESLQPAEKNEALCRIAMDIWFIAGKIEQQKITMLSSKDELVTELKEFVDLAQDIDPRISEAVNEVVCLLFSDNLSPEILANSKQFARAFGRGQQYVSLIKKTVGY